MTVAVYYYLLRLLISDGLVVLDDKGTVFYISLGKWAALVDLVKTDFKRAKSGYVLQPGNDKTLTDAAAEARDRIVQMIENPMLIDSLRGEVSYKYIFGTAAQQKIWDYLVTRVPFDKRSSYAQVAKEMGRPNGARVVGTACSANRIALIVPCHRILTILGEITGYRYGVALKRRLLNLEAGKKSGSV